MRLRPALGFSVIFVTRGIGPVIGLALGLALATGGCGGDDDGSGGPDGGGGDGAISASCAEATQHSDLAWIQDNILTKSCAQFSSCHNNGTSTATKKLDLRAGKAYAELVDVASQERPEMKLVVPGDPAASYLVIKLGDGDQSKLVEVTMPFNNPLLCQEKRDAVKRWIERGAPQTETSDAGPDANP